ncbi:MAG: nucleotide exchange factor GrpE [Actinobacteria bacterium]|nr:nucleotide exchange factor GrpE [Actinomycetota bacterium]MBU1945311.1 nucleotide exchange factor GrpE [Actinomycetota bacterium]MBU2686511.1 nucleotide exchange factor GrpE [Actinomycetota bacterium]
MSKGTGQKKTGADGGKGTGGRKTDIEIDPGEATEAEAMEEIVEGEIEEALEEAAEASGLAERNAELLDSLQRLKADFDNYRKRMVKEQTRILETAEAELVRKLLPVIDNLERALASADGKESNGLRDGVALVLEMTQGVLGKEGLEVIDPQGEPFDPEHHEAMMVVETDECPEDTVVEVIQKGYRFRGVLLRPAMVQVSCPVKG